MKKRLLYSALVSILSLVQINLLFAQRTSTIRFRGIVSSDSENVKKEIDLAFPSRISQKRFQFGEKQSANTMSLTGMANGIEIMKEATQNMIAKEYKFTLLSGHKYMVNDCLGLKVSAGEFQLKFKNPYVALTTEGDIMIKLEVDLIKFNALKIRVKPRSPDFADPNPCHFSGKFEIGGEAKNLTMTAYMNPVVSSYQGVGGATTFCLLGYEDAPKVDWVINTLNVFDFMNSLDGEIRKMVLDGLDFGVYNILLDAFIEIVRTAMQKYYETCELASAYGKYYTQYYVAESIENNTKYEVAGNDINNTNPAKKDSAEKWATTANNLKTSTGRLLMDNPKGSKWTIYIYSMVTNKFITSANQLKNKALFVLSPGDYKITINNAPVENVQIKKGHDTKLNTGVLDITADAVWYLYDKTGKTFYTSGNKPEKLVLPVGTYKITLHNAPVENVQVNKGLDTRFKTGVLDITGNDVWYLYDEAGKTSYTSGNKPKKLMLPVGNYVLDVGGTKQPVVVNEIPVANEIGIENTEDLIKNTHGPWVITDLPALKPAPGKIAKGLLDLNFDGNSNWSIQVKNTQTGESFQANRNATIPTRDKTLSLDPGEYDINLNNVIIKNVPIRSNKKTRIKAGLVTVHYITPGGSSLPVKVYVYDMNKSYNEYYFLANGPMQKIMPVGTYGLRVWGDWPANSIEINDKATKQLIITTKIFTIQANGISWLLCNTDDTVVPCYFFGGSGTKTLYLPLGNYKLKYGSTSVTVTVSSTGQNSVTIPQ